MERELVSDFLLRPPIDPGCTSYTIGISEGALQRYFRTIRAEQRQACWESLVQYEASKRDPELERPHIHSDKDAILNAGKEPLEPYGQDLYDEQQERGKE